MKEELWCRREKIKSQREINDATCRFKREKLKREKKMLSERNAPLN